MKRVFTLISAALLCHAVTYAQNGVSSIFVGNVDDVSKLTTAYVNPLLKGFSNGLNGGWTNTARTLKTLRFTIRVSASGSIVPNADKNFDFTKIGLSSQITPTNANQTISPTFAGSSGNGAGITVSDPNQPAYKYNTNLPGGVLAIIPSPQIQLTVGLPFNTDITLRTIPTIKVNSDVGSIGMFGVGVKHNFSKDLGKAGKLLPFDLALAVGYTRITYSLPLNVTPQTPNGGVSGSTDFSNQNLTGHFSGYNIQGIISKKLLFFTPFFAAGYSGSSTSIGLTGNYPYVTGVNVLGQPKYTSYANPISINNSGVNGLHADVGFQLSLVFFKLYASYTAASYSSLNAGIGLGF